MEPSCADGNSLFVCCPACWVYLSIGYSPANSNTPYEIHVRLMNTKTRVAKAFQAKMEKNYHLPEMIIAMQAEERYAVLYQLYAYGLKIKTAEENRRQQMPRQSRSKIAELTTKAECIALIRAETEYFHKYSAKRKGRPVSPVTLNLRTGRIISALNRYDEIDRQGESAR